METKIIGAYLLRSYVWRALEVNLGLKTTDYDINGDGKGIVPIVPLGEEPELEAFKKPYLVYGFSETTGDFSAETEGTIVFVIYSETFSEMSKVANTISRLFDDEDCANNVNEFTSTIPSYYGLRFGNVELLSQEGGVPEESSGGRMSAMVSLNYNYYANYSVEKSFAVWNPEAGVYLKS